MFLMRLVWYEWSGICQLFLLLDEYGKSFVWKIFLVIYTRSLLFTCSSSFINKPTLAQHILC